MKLQRGSNLRKKLNKKALTLGGVALLLIGAVAANLIINGRADPGGDGQDGAAVSASTQANFFDTFRADRTETREKEIAYIDTIVMQGADADTLADAQQQKLTIVGNMEKELTVESLLKAKGFSDAAVTLHAGSVNVILKADTLTDEQVAQVLEIVLRETGEIADHVKVTTAQ